MNGHKKTRSAIAKAGYPMISNAAPSL